MVERCPLSVSHFLLHLLLNCLTKIVEMVHLGVISRLSAHDLDFITKRSSSIGVHEKAGSTDADIGRWETVSAVSGFLRFFTFLEKGKVLGNGKGASVFATRDSAHTPGRIHGLTPKIMSFNRWGHIALNVISISCSGLAFSERQEGWRYRTGFRAPPREVDHKLKIRKSTGQSGSKSLRPATSVDFTLLTEEYTFQAGSGPQGRRVTLVAKARDMAAAASMNEVDCTLAKWKARSQEVSATLGTKKGSGTGVGSALQALQLAIARRVCTYSSEVKYFLNGYNGNLNIFMLSRS
ncbi:hypothetical protein BGW80DRAFT_1253709 [Lactifluus volemus]|nr:hypothetical protein BGW80DRAFT_1253709 [Lactifluus volemus]